jgi:hypothetical protein
MDLVAALGSIFGLFILFSLAIVWIIALVDILRSDFKDSNEKLIWVLLVIFLPFLGSILYFVIGRSRKINR